MKIAFIGSHGLGKTALCYDLVARLKRDGIDADMVKEVARACPLPVNQTTSLDAQRWILCTQMAKEIETMARCAVTVCDRSVLDNYAYLARAHGYQEDIEAGFLDNWIHTYALTVYLPVPTGGIQADGFRDIDAAFVRDIDRQVCILIQRYFRSQSDQFLALTSNREYETVYRAVKALWEKKNARS